MPSDTSYRLTIKNMVCPRCIDTVSQIAQSTGIESTDVRLGELVTASPVSQSQLAVLTQKLGERGFAIIESDSARQISRIKSLIIERVHYAKGEKELKLSAYLSQHLNYDYSRLSKLFSAVEGITIERFAIQQRVERAKELLVYGEQTIAGIAEELEYSSPAHLSAQFKNETGMTPSVFKQLRNPPRRSLDEF